MQPVYRTRAARLGLAAALAAAAATTATAQGEVDPATIPVTYSSEQADRGERRFERDCADCHGDDLRGGLNGGAPLRGSMFEQKYMTEMPASVLFSYMSNAMPPQSPGRYSADAYADLMAYVLKWNGFQPGAPLPTDLDALDEVIIDK